MADTERRRSISQDVLARVRALMQERELSQREVVRRAQRRGHHLSSTTMTRMFAGEQDTRLNSLEAIAAGLGVSLSDLVGPRPGEVPTAHRQSSVVWVPAGRVIDGRIEVVRGRESVPFPGAIGEGRRLVVLDVTQHGMEPELEPGDRVVVDVEHSRLQLQDGDLVAVAAPGGDELLVARAYRRGRRVEFVADPAGDAAQFGRDDDILGGVVHILKAARRREAPETKPNPRPAEMGDPRALSSS